MNLRKLPASLDFAELKAAPADDDFPGADPVRITAWRALVAAGQMNLFTAYRVALILFCVLESINVAQGKNRIFGVPFVVALLILAAFLPQAMRWLSRVKPPPWQWVARMEIEDHTDTVSKFFHTVHQYHGGELDRGDRAGLVRQVRDDVYGVRPEYEFLRWFPAFTAAGFVSAIFPAWGLAAVAAFLTAVLILAWLVFIGRAIDLLWQVRTVSAEVLVDAMEAGG